MKTRVDVLDLLYPEFKTCLHKLSTSPSSSPYFLRSYEKLCSQHIEEGCQNAVLLGMYVFNDCSQQSCIMGYLLGETSISRSVITGDIYFLFVHNLYRGHGFATTLYDYFEKLVVSRSVSLGVKSVTMRITMKECIRSSFDFWKKLIFVGSNNSVCLIKQIKCYRSLYLKHNLNIAKFYLHKDD